MISVYILMKIAFFVAIGICAGFFVLFAAVAIFNTTMGLIAYGCLKLADWMDRRRFRK